MVIAWVAPKEGLSYSNSGRIVMRAGGFPSLLLAVAEVTSSVCTAQQSQAC